LPVFCELTEESELAIRAAPLAVMISIARPKAINVVDTRPG
jgi:hypothetical protein